MGEICLECGVTESGTAGNEEETTIGINKLSIKILEQGKGI
jgi:hypothetical protein